MDIAMTENQPKAWPGIRASIWIIILVVLAGIVFSPVDILLRPLIGREATLFFSFVLTMGVPLWIIYLFRKRFTGQKGFRFSIPDKGTIPYAIIGTIALSVGVVLPLVSITLYIFPVPEAFAELMRQIGDPTHIAVFATLVIAAPVLEEFIFRGVILDGLLKKHSPYRAIMVSSLLFAIVHLNPWQFVTAFIMGLFIGWVYYRTGSLSMAIIIHGANNLFVTIPAFFMEDDAFWDMEPTLAEAYGGWLILAPVLLLAWILLGFSLNALKKRFNAAPPKPDPTQTEV